MEVSKPELLEWLQSVRQEFNELRLNEEFGFEFRRRLLRVVQAIDDVIDIFKVREY